MRVNLLVLLEGSYVTLTYTTSIKFHCTLSFYSVNYSITEHFLRTNPCEEYWGFRENSIHLPSYLYSWDLRNPSKPVARMLAKSTLSHRNRIWGKTM